MQNPKLKGFDGVEPCGTALLSLPAGEAAGWAAGQMYWEAGGSQASSSCAPAAGDPSAHGTALPRAVCLVLTTAVCARGGSVQVSLPLLKPCKSWRFWGVCFAGGGGRGLFRSKGSNWSRVTTFLFVFCHAKMGTIWWPWCLKIYTETNAWSCIYSSLLETGGNSSCSSLKVIVPNLSNNKILIRVTGIIPVYPWQSAKACITLQACCQILVSAKDVLDLWSWSFLVL